MDFMSICRTCMSDTSLNPIFAEMEDNTPFHNIILQVTGVKIIKNDGLPQKICSVCLNHINDALKFKSKCKDTEEKLLNIKSILEAKSLSITCSNKLEIQNIPEGTDDNDKNLPDHVAFREVHIKTSEDDDDKPLKYLIHADTDNDIDRIDNFNDSVAKPLLMVKTGYTNDILKNETNEANMLVSNDTLIVKKNKLTIVDGNNDCLNYIVIDDKRVICKLCQKNLSIRSIDTHMSRSHPGADERKAKCELCDSYIMKEKMDRHKMLIHGSERLRCRYCKWEFDSEKSLTDHVVICTARKKRTVCESSREMLECDICHKTMQRASLKMHKAIKHAGLGPVCEHCGKRFGNKLRLNEHYRAKHGYEKFKCTYCEFRSASVVALRNHERRHLGEKPFVCELCGAKFHAAYLLAQHRHSHRTDKRYKCEICGARFKANNGLHTHKRACHRETRAACTLCARPCSCRHHKNKKLRSVCLPT